MLTLRAIPPHLETQCVVCQHPEEGVGSVGGSVGEPSQAMDFHILCHHSHTDQGRLGRCHGSEVVVGLAMAVLPTVGLLRRRKECLSERDACVYICPHPRRPHSASQMQTVVCSVLIFILAILT